MDLCVKILPDEETRKFPAECNDCGWIGSSGECGVSKGHPESGCSGDIHCPVCGSNEIEATDNLQNVTTYIDRLRKSNAMVKKLTDQVEEYDSSKFIYTHFEKENREMAKEIAELKSKLGIPYAI